MHTRWHIAFFICFSLISTGIAIFAMLKAHIEKRERTQKDNTAVFNPFAIASCLLSLAALSAIVLGFNSPAKAVNILARPGAPLSSSVIAQIFLAVLMLIFAFKFRKGQSGYFLAALVVIVCAASIICMSRIYMINMRPSTNTWILPVLLFLIVLQIPLYSIRTNKITIAVCVLYGLLVIIFAFRMKSLPFDRSLPYDSMIWGSMLAVSYWGWLFIGFVLPLFVLMVPNLRKNKPMRKLQMASFTIGVFLFCCLINQTPLIIKAIGNRPHF